MGTRQGFTIDDVLDSDSTECMFCRKPVRLIEAVHMPGRGSICGACAMRIERGLQGLRSGDSVPAVMYMDDFNTDIFDTDIGEEKDECTELGDICVPVPTVIYNKLSEYVIGQSKAKRALSVAAYNHYKRIQIGHEGIAKSNILLIGSTGSGKTLLVNTLKRILGVPCVCFSATSLTEAGYVGNDVEKPIELLLHSADDNVERAQKGIVFIDEVDKLVDRGVVGTSGNSVGRSGVQQALLTLMEGSDVEVAKKDGGRVMLNTSNMLFIFGGSFAGIEDIVAKRLRAQASIGFGGCVFDASQVRSAVMDNVTTEDLREFGMLSEFLGRAPRVVVMEPVTVELLEKVLTEPKNGLIWQYQELLKYDGIELKVESGALKKIAKQAYDLGVGCRGLRRVCEELFAEVMFSLPGTDCAGVVFTEECVDGASPRVIGREKTGGMD